MLTLQTSYTDNYDGILPVFLYTKPEQLSGISSDMDRAIKKATKVISLHSITAKPKIDEGKELTDEEREFYSKFEYNKWVDDSYLLMGKSYFYKNEYDKASETFNYLTTNFAKEPSINETKLWLARLALENGRIKEAEDYLLFLEEADDLTKNIKFELQATLAHKAIIQEDYPTAIAALKQAIELSNRKYYRQRYTFIVAQLYQEIKQGAEASENYLAVIKMNPPYEMTFNARINMAMAYESGSGSMREIEKQLEKLLKDDKNIDYQDQIYYAWGNLYYKSGDLNKAVEYYLKSASSSKGNTSLLARTYLTIADIYYDKPNYVSAQTYYDSTVTLIDATYPNYPIIYAKSISLTNLVEQINTVTFQDSVLRLSRLPEPELYALIDKRIEDDKTAEEEKQRRAEEAQEQSNETSQQTFELQSNTESKWYFYNSNLLKLGSQEFKKNWGTRKLEDDWRRKNKSSVSFDDDHELEEENGENGVGENGKKAVSKYSREYYLANIPFSDSAKTVSREKIKMALFEMGNIYNSELKDYGKATDAYKELLKRYPDFENKLVVYYKLYMIAKETRDKPMETNYKQKIIREFPESNYAKVLSDPEYFKKIEAEERKVYNMYANAYKLFDDRNFVQVANIANRAMVDYPENELKPQFDYMLTISKGVSKDTSEFIGDLQKLISRYPASDIAQNSTLLINYLSHKNPQASVKQQIKQAVEIYKLNKNEEHLLVVSVAKPKYSNQMMFNIINFNLDNFEEDDLKVKKYDMNGTALLNVTKFKDAKVASEYLEKLLGYENLWRDVDEKSSHIFLISRGNYNLLKKEGNLEQYLLFYKKQY